MRSIIEDRFCWGRTQKWGAKRLGFIFGYILITTALITTVLTATERGKDCRWVFLSTGVII